MIRKDDWHAQTIKEIQRTLISRNGVLALALFGSTLRTNGEFDKWSDLDLLLVIHDGARPQFYPTTDWLQFGELYATQQSENACHSTTRVCFADFRRIDFVITTESKLSRLAEWQVVPFWRGTQLIFSHSLQVTQLLDQTRQSPKVIFPSQADFDEMVNHFWFKATLASHKIVRDDRLIALHLALDLVRDCCVVGMILRDKTEGTNFHRGGGSGNDIVTKLNDACTATDILNIIEQSAVRFDELAATWSPSYQARRYPLLTWLDHIRRTHSLS